MPQPRRIGLLLFLVTLALYLPVAWFGFCVYDDGLYVTEAPMVQNGVTLAGVKWAFTTMAAGNWHPLTWLSHMVDCGVFGLNPAGPHLVNAGLHAANTVLLFLLLLRLTGRLWPCAFIAALFAWHPLHVESVAWIAERKDVLSTFFALLSLLAFADYVRTRNDKSSRAKMYFIWSLLAFALGLMAKPMLVTLPFVLLVLDFWPLRRMQDFKWTLPNFKLLLEKGPFFLITLASCVITYIAQSRMAVTSLEAVPLLYRLKSVPIAYVEYLGKIFWPAKLAVFYPLQGNLSASHAAAAAILLIAISFIAWQLRRAAPYWLAGWLWFIGMLVPVIGLVQAGGAAFADRYTYLPAVGIFLAITFATCEIAARFRIAKSILTGAAILMLAASVIAMENQLRHWQNSITLFQHALAVTVENDVTHNNLGVALEQAGRRTEAIEHYRAAARLAPERYQGHNNLANALGRLGQTWEALVEHLEAARIGTNVAFLHYALGQSLELNGQTDEALREFSEAIRLDPDYSWPHVDMARIYLQQSQASRALAELRTALQIAPDNVDVLTFTAQLLATTEDASVRNGSSAFVLAAKANLLSGGTRPFVLDVLGMACAEMGKFDEAQVAAQTALDTAAALKIQGVEPIQHRLELYKKHQPWRESFGATNAPVKN